MRWAVVILVILGLLAALSAALLISGSPLRRASIKVSPEDDVVLAVKSLSSATVITASDVTKGKALRKELPEGYLSSPVQAIGKILDVPVVEGQVLTKSLFVTEGSGAQLAAALPEGMRAVSVTISNASNRGGLFYPGCVVDVLASFKLGGQNESGQAISTTLLRGIQVLAVEGTSVVSKEAEEKAPGQAERTVSKGLTVTLMVDSKQAEALQVAIEYGTISLAMRNPLDKRPVEVDATVLSQGRLAKFGSALDPAVFAAQNRKGQPPDINDLAAQVKSTAQQPTLGEKPVPEGKPSWPVTVIRGKEVKQQELDIREIKAAPRAGI